MTTQAQSVTLDEHPSIDYPAAHSMDTTWFAVDENGEIGRFETSDSGCAPMLEGMEPPTPEEQERREYSKAFDYPDQYRAIEKYFEQELGKDSKPRPVHDYGQDGNHDSLYYWQASPEKVITLEELPAHLRSGRYLLRLKDYDFRSREPVSPYDYVTQCYNDWGCGFFYPDGYDHTPLPLLNADGSWSLRAFNACKADLGLFHGRGFFAMDESGSLALFRTDRFGALPLEKVSGAISSMMDTHDDIYHRFPFPHDKRYDEFMELRDGRDMDTWKELTLGGPDKRPHPILAPRAEKAEREWQEKGPAHWLEYPFGPASPRLVGLYHYDASWHHPLPYLRIGVPMEPLHFGQLDDELRERMKPVRLPGIRFAEVARVQPFELVPCFSASIDGIDEDFGWKFPQIWIDAALEHVYPCHEFAEFSGSVELLLRRARSHISRVERLTRP